MDAALDAFGVAAVGVVALVHRARFGAVAANVDSSSSGATNRDSCRRAVSICQASGRPVRVQTAS
jgi:hypothetical protein